MPPARAADRGPLAPVAFVLEFPVILYSGTGGRWSFLELASRGHCRNRSASAWSSRSPLRSWPGYTWGCIRRAAGRSE